MESRNKNQPETNIKNLVGLIIKKAKAKKG